MENKNDMQQTDEINLVDYVVLVLKEKELIIKVTLVAMVFAAFVTLFIPPTYLAEAKILPPQNAGSSMSSLMASQIGFSGAVLGLKTTNDLYVSLIKTRGVADYVIDKLDLMKRYKTKTREATRRILAANLVLADEKKSGMITIGFQNPDPKDAAEIANAYIEGLQNLNNQLAITEAGQRRLFFEEQLKNAKENLIKSEENLKYFQQRTGTIKIDDEAKAVIGTVAEMRAKISAKEVQLRVMKTYATQENPDFLRLQDETAALKEELRKMESNSRLTDDSVPTVGKMSSLGTEYIRRMREFRYNETLYEILMKQFEAAKLDETKDAALVQIVERAEAPETRVKPQRRKIVVNVGVVAFLLSVFFILSRAYYQAIVANPRGQAEMERLKSSLDFSQLISDFKLDVALDALKTVARKK